jgi:hypothetical protein
MGITVNIADDNRTDESLTSVRTIFVSGFLLLGVLLASVVAAQNASLQQRVIAQRNRLHGQTSNPGHEKRLGHNSPCEQRTAARAVHRHTQNALEYPYVFHC